MCVCVYIYIYIYIYIYAYRSQWPRCLRRSSAAARLLKLWVRNPLRVIDVCRLLSVVCCQIEVSATGRSLVQRGPIGCDASLYVV